MIVKMKSSVKITSANIDLDTGGDNNGEK